MKKASHPAYGAPPETRTPVKVAIIDDNEDDRALVARELKQGSQKFLIHEVFTPEGLADLLKHGDFDLIITDYQLKWENGLNILRAIKFRTPDVPVIMFTGTGSEEIAVEAMKSGLDDYVLKSPRQYRRLSIAVQSSLKMREKRKELREAELRYKHLFETVPIGLFRCTPTGQLLDVNRALVETLGFASRDVILKIRMGDLHLSAEEFSRWREMLERDGAVAHFESRLRHAREGFRWVKIHAKALRDHHSRQIFYEGSVEDVTQYKKEEEAKERIIEKLEEALANVKSLSGLLPICSGCKKIRDEHGEWTQLELFIRNHSDAEFTHSFCPDCMKRLYPEIFVDMPK